MECEGVARDAFLLIYFLTDSTYLLTYLLLTCSEPDCEAAGGAEEAR